LDGDPVIRLALERALEIVGEAAGRIPGEVQARHPDIPWRAMIGARHRLAHGYFALDRALLWRTAREVIPATLPRLHEIVRLEAADRPPTEDEP
ncbi:MAG TPA: HepT-like ribonuclease domain-containing protein, partial [Geminicoccaceae bacterium]|nr:HepT-like ribonuclease domain-containing protein [Geminicoccaceae bacterium]